VKLSVLFNGSGRIKDICEVLYLVMAVCLQNPLRRGAEVDNLLLEKELKR
jgi:hypothetical protein